MSTYNYLYKKRLPTAVVTVAAIAGVTLAAMPFTFAHAANDDNKSPVKDIVSSFLQWRGQSNHSSSSVWELLPPGIAKKIFDHWQMPGVGNDETNPQILDIDTSVDEDDVMIRWQTDEKTRGVVLISEEPGIDEDDEDATELSSWRLSKNHTITTDDLDDDTTYYAVVKATDKAGNETLSDEFSFTTGEDDDNDTTAPVISNLDTDTSEKSATVQWNTNEEANSVLYLSKVSPVDPHASGTIKISDATLEESHELTATNLEEDTTYYGIVTSTDEDGNTATSSPFTLTTDEDTSDPLLSNIDWDASTSSVTFSWDTNEPATSVLHTATTSGFAIGDSTVEVDSSAALTTSHELTVSGLTSSTTYYHRIVSVDESGNQTISAQYTTTTD